MEENNQTQKATEIDWKSLIPSKFLYINNDPKKREKLEKKYGKSYDQLDPVNDKIDDTDLVIMLGGLKHLLKLRKYKSVKYSIKESNPEYASVNCSILFIGNDETSGQDIEYSDNACAHLNNTNSFVKHYLVEIATNRALCRTIRSFLNLNIISKEELSENSSLVEENNNSSNNNLQVDLLQKELDKVHCTWEQFKNKLIKDKVEGAENMKSLNDLSKDLIFSYLERLKKAKKKEEEKQQF